VFPAWFAGFALASIAIGALVPAAMMAIAAANLFSRNVYLEFVQPNASAHKQMKVSKVASLVVKFGAVGFVVFVPTTFVINFQLAAGVWILQTLPAVFVGLFWRGLDRRATLAGWAVGMAIGTLLLSDVGFKTSSYTLGIGHVRTSMFIGVVALAANLVVVLAGSLASSARARVGRRALLRDTAPAPR
jgi:SSS family solute:Na+ symporter